MFDTPEFCDNRFGTWHLASGIWHLALNARHFFDATSPDFFPLTLQRLFQYKRDPVRSL
jgi:hypothetical protein